MSFVAGIKYTNYTNIDASFCRAYEPGDRLVRGWQGELPPCFTPREDLPLEQLMLGIAEVLFARHNRDDRPDGRMCPSMSVGDVVVIGETAMSVDHVGFKVVTLDESDLITDRTWVEMVS